VARGPNGGVGLGLLLVVDLGRANLPGSSPGITSRSMHEPGHRHAPEQALRTTGFRRAEWIGRALRVPPELGLIDQIYRGEWAQHHFLYYNIHSLDVVQMPRMPRTSWPSSRLSCPQQVARAVFQRAQQWQHPMLLGHKVCSKAMRSRAYAASGQRPTSGCCSRGSGAGPIRLGKSGQSVPVQAARAEPGQSTRARRKPSS